MTVLPPDPDPEFAAFHHSHKFPRWAMAAIVAGILIGITALVVSLTGFGSAASNSGSAAPMPSAPSSSASSSASPSSSASSSSSASPSSPAVAPSTPAVAAPAVCTKPTAVPSPFAGGVIPHVGTDTTWWGNLLSATQAKKLSPLMVYGGAVVDQSTLNNWVASVQSHCMPAGVDVGAWYQNGGMSAVIKMVQALNSQPDVQRYVVSADDIGDATPGTVNALVAAIQGATTTGAKVTTGSDMTDYTSPSTSTASIRAFAGFTSSVAYYPYIGSTGPHFYGPMSALTIAGQADFAVNGANSVAWVQAFDWRASDPTDAAYFGFPATNIQPKDVAAMAATQVKAGARSVLAITLEPKSDNITYLVSVFAGITAVVQCGGMSS